MTGAVDMACDDDHLLALEEIFHRSDRTLPLRMSVHYLITVQGSTQDRRERVQRAIDHRKRIAELGLGPWLQVAGIKVIADGVIDACKKQVLTALRARMLNSYSEQVPLS